MRPKWLKSTIQTLHSSGINCVGVAPGKPYEHLLPGCNSAVVFGNGGTHLWDNFIEDLRRNPDHLRQHKHPFDDFIHRCISEADPNPEPNRRWIRCAAEEDVFIDFRPLAHAAGIGSSSQMGLLIHPLYGLWVGLRAVLLTTEPLQVAPHKSEDSPCNNCDDKPCITACPAGAVQTTGWDVKRCAQFHTESERCHGRCHSRLSCPVGFQHQHGALQHQYHNARQSGREQLAKALSIKDNIMGMDPPWQDWT